MRRRELLLTGGSLLWGAPSMFGQARPSSGKGQAKMNLELKLTIANTRITGGESIAVKLQALNRGPEPLTLETGPGNSIVYELRNLEGGGASRVSRLGYSEGLREGRPTKPLPSRIKTLAPGDAHTFSDDLAQFAMYTIHAGEYRVTAILEGASPRVVSNPVTVEVKAPKVHAMNALYCPYSESTSCMYDHTGDDGSGFILQRDAGYLFPHVGTFRRLAALGASKSAPQLAQSIHTEPRLEERWYLWMEGRRAGAFQSSGASVTSLGPSIAAPMLAATGFQSTSDKAVFWCAGLLNGASHAQKIEVSQGGITYGPPAALGASKPANLLACELGESHSGFALIWRDGHAIYKRQFGPNGMPRNGGEVKLYESQGAEILCMEMNPIPDDPAHLHALVAPHGSAAKLRYLRIPLDPKGMVETRELDPPTEKCSAWAITAVLPSPLVVVALGEDQLMFTHAGVRGADWEELLEVPPSIQHLKIVANERRFWAAVWIDPEVGFGSRMDPAYVR